VTTGSKKHQQNGRIELDWPMENWQTFTDPRFQLRFRYPAVAPNDHMVEMIEQETSDFSRVHLISRDSQEVYFEVRRHRDLLPQEEYRQHRAYLEKRFEEQGFRITELTDRRIGESVAHQYSFQWDEKQRVAILIQQDRITYRIIYDPTSPINIQMLSSMELIE
jgi:phenylpropionate dioxygenase-like ring-hydroxylating dioxygenase large terminal subunit